MGSDRTHSVRKELSGSPAATGDGAYLYGASFPASACYLCEDSLRLIDLFRLRPFDPAAKRDDLRIGRQCLAAHRDRARMMWDHRAQEPAVAYRGLGADQPNIKAAERFEGDGLAVVLDETSQQLESNQTPLGNPECQQNPGFPPLPAFSSLALRRFKSRALGEAAAFAVGNRCRPGSNSFVRGFGPADPLAFQLRQHPGQASQRSHGPQPFRQESGSLRQWVCKILSIRIPRGREGAGV